MAQRSFEDSSGRRYGIDQVQYDPTTGNYYAPGSNEALTPNDSPTSYQEKYQSEQDDFVQNSSVDGESTDQGYTTNPQVDGSRPQSASLSEDTESGSGGASGVPTTSKLATGNNLPPQYRARFDEAKSNNGMVMAQHTPTKLTDDQGQPLPDDQEDPKVVKISEPLSAYNAQYPFNQVNETESGHSLELDDTPGAERVALTHRSGTFIEMHPDGRMVDKTMDDRHTYTGGKSIERVKDDVFKLYDKSVTIKTSEGTVTFQLESGDMNITINSGNVNLHIAGGNLNMKVNGNVNEEITGNVTRKIAGNLIEQVTGNVTRETTGNVQHTTSGTTTDNTSGDYTVTGATINLN